MQIMRAVSVGLSALAILSACKEDPPSPYLIEIETTEVALNPDSPDQRRVGKLTYKGGIEITSADDRVGGLSGLIVSADGKEMLSVTDEGQWFKAKLSYSGGNLSGAYDAEMVPMLDLDGEELFGKQGDAEAVELAPGETLNGKVLVSFERNHRVWSYDLSQGLAQVKPTPVAMPPALDQAKNNEGVEAFGFSNPSTLLAITEGTLDEEQNIVGWLVPFPPGEAAGTSSRISLKSRDPFRPTDMAVIPGGDVLVLERRYNPLTGVGMQLRRVAASAIKPDATMEGEVLANLPPNYSIDNMEGLAVRTSGRDTLVYALSDNNFSRVQRTLLLLFKLEEN